MNLIGKTFNFLTVIGRSERKSSRDSYWLCKCVCGKEKEIKGGDLRNGHSKSCGCYQKSKASKRMSSVNNPMKNHEISMKQGHNKGIKTKPHNQETIERHRQACLRNWKSNEYVRKQMKAKGVSPNKTELRFEKLLNDLYPGEWKYVGDGQVILGGKCPDFININGQKKIIELYGDYWHKGDNPEDRAKVFEPFGYQTLVVWEKELRDMNKLKETIMEFA
jgi:G:T-mismatch repair DNA endonuclease (very short patch repair protein)